jgi:hypothetical protein
MKTKAQIVGELLKDGKINAEDAVVLLTPEYVSYPQYPIWNPPYYYYNNPLVNYCGTGGNIVPGTTTSGTNLYNTLTNN